MPEMKNKFKKAKRLYLCIVCAVLLLAGCASDTVPNEHKSDGKTVETVYVEAYNNTAVLENYSMEAQISLRKLLFEAKVSGIVKKQDGAYTGTAVLKLPGKKYNYEYVSPCNGNDTCTELRSEEGNKYLSFNIANIGEGVIRPLPEEIVETGEFTNSKKSIIEFSVTNEQAYELYGAMIEYFKESAAEYIDLSSEDSVEVFEEEREKSVGLSAILSAIGLK